MEILDGQVHLPRMVTDWRAGHPRATDVDAPAARANGLPLVEPAEWDVMLAASLSAMDAAGVDALVIDEWHGQDDEGFMAPNIRLPGGTRRYTFDFATYAAARYPERFAWLARLNPDDPDLERVAAEMASRPGMRCIRVDPLPWLGQHIRFAAGEYAPVFQAARAHGLPVSVWSNGPYLPHLERYLRDFPDVTVVLDHMGTSNPPADLVGPDRYAEFEPVFELGRRYPNLSVKWSTADTGSAFGYPFPDMVPLLLDALDAFGPKRLMWASDWSEHKISMTWAQSFGWILDSSELSTEDKEWVLARTARRILGWPVLEGGKIGEGTYLDCAASHPVMRVVGHDAPSFLRAMRAHLALWHPHVQVRDEHLLSRARS